ncbi:MAG: DUF883 family protein [Nitratireductor sp.]|nr:DUF883 family protein [Nitratireductor sp.]
MPRTATDTKTNGSANPKASGNLGKDIDKQIDRIRNEIRSLAETVTEAGVVVAGDVKTQAAAKASDARATSQQVFEDLNKQLATVEKQLAGHVRRKPVSSLAIAAGVGFLAALIARR